MSCGVGEGLCYSRRNSPVRLPVLFTNVFHMLEEQDLQKIGNLFDAKFGVLEAKIDNLDAKVDVLDAKIDTTEKNILTAVDTKLEKVKQEIVISVGEMLEDNVFPQFEEVHRELRRMNIMVGWQQ